MVFNHSRVNDTKCTLMPLLIVTGIEIDLFAFSCSVNFPVFAWHEFIFFGALSIVILKKKSNYMSASFNVIWCVNENGDVDLQNWLIANWKLDGMRWDVMWWHWIWMHEILFQTRITMSSIRSVCQDLFSMKNHRKLIKFWFFWHLQCSIKIQQKFEKK